MSDPSLYTFPSPLEGWRQGEPLPDQQHSEGPNAKSYVNPPPTTPSAAYKEFTNPITNSTRGGFDVHIYFLQTSPSESHFAQELWERIRREFPELRIYRVWDKPIGPHPVAMFEVNLFTPEQFGAFVPWLVIHRGPLSVLLHPNTGDDVRDHTQLATWWVMSADVVRWPPRLIDADESHVGWVSRIRYKSVCLENLHGIRREEHEKCAITRELEKNCYAAVEV
ncbi:hypothetical protein D0863_07805 [Hortaea werneckii]|uniref:DOPA 4,5-dioxygenase n=1 Tax=Hortaea werneckii TaxID=91943 RepID=A0A3M7DT35_HORWE|nr:hypothetical protein D0863_07805 [Hortaea werneckii]